VLDRWADMVRAWFAKTLRECQQEVVVAPAPAPAPARPSFGGASFFGGAASTMSMAAPPPAPAPVPVAPPLTKLQHLAQGMAAAHSWNVDYVVSRLKALASSRDLALFSPHAQVPVSSYSPLKAAPSLGLGTGASSIGSGARRHSLHHHHDGSGEAYPCDTTLLFHFFAHYMASYQPTFPAVHVGPDATGHIALLLDSDASSDMSGSLIPGDAHTPLVLVLVHGKVYRPGTRRDSLFKALALFAYFVQVTAAGYVVGVVPLDRRGIGLEVGQGATGSGRVFDRHFADCSPKKGATPVHV
jgi:hypothetical protein